MALDMVTGPLEKVGGMVPVLGTMLPPMLVGAGVVLVTLRFAGVV